MHNTKQGVRLCSTVFIVLQYNKQFQSILMTRLCCSFGCGPQLVQHHHPVTASRRRSHSFKVSY